MADAPEDPDDEHGSPMPSTPPLRQARPVCYRPYRRDDIHHGDMSTTHPSPPGSPSMSPYSLGMSPLSPFRRQFRPPSRAPSSPLYPHSDSYHPSPDHGSHEDTTQDSRDVLVQRLSDLVTRVSQGHVEDESIYALHAKVDELESVLRLRDKSSNIRYDGQDQSDLSWEPPHPDTLLPSDASSLVSPQRPSPSAKASKKTGPRASKMTREQAERIAAEAQDLHNSLEIFMSNLRDRQEETEHIHGLLIARLERAAQRIIQLEEQLKNLERERKESDTELLNMQIQLKAIEVQCMSYVPQGVDQELSESISAWQREYSAQRQKRLRNREQYNGTPTRRRAAQ
ncbi:hypothetical protein F5B22DRAFT_623106 [Xylaria bambusicola]|uniref:uncharacterized protein n=1 Tax=Xylaria bambusicola TaxID=326684 RepID=UPI0020072333|nr:uncharacterized protein F5B22DRAFT_623106 [Xylaria bambusicola]KAI0506593.1 hypothetical protein F5B22DRAFT_623106 [Xylaria bambusicola]